MKPISKIVAKFENIGYEPIRWTDVYDTEGELLNDLMGITIREEYPNPTKGYIYLSGFQAKLKRGETLTDKQMTLLKRLAYVVAFEKYLRDKTYMGNIYDWKIY